MVSKGRPAYLQGFGGYTLNIPWKISLLTGLAGLIIPVGAFPAYAQPAASADRPADNEIIVTALRRSERLEDVPASVAVLTSETMAAAGVTSLRDIANVTSGFQLGLGGAFPQPAIRGVTSLINGTFENNVPVYVDGFYQVAAQAINIDLPNVESVQVLKGPQGTLYGRNATGGAILLNTISPSDTWRGRAEVTYARFDDKRASGYVAGPLSDKIGISLAGYIRRSDGYTKLASRTIPGAIAGNAAPLEQDSVRVKLKANLTENFTATLGYNYTHVSDARGNMFTPYENVSPLVYQPTPGANTLPPTKLGVAAWDYDAKIDTKQHEGTLTLALDTGIGALKSYTGYSVFTPITSFDFDGSYTNNGWSTSKFRQKTFQQAIDYSIDAIKNVDIIVGGLYFHDRLKTIDPHIVNYIVLPPAPPVTSPPPFSSLTAFNRTTNDQKKDAWAIYASLTFHVTDALSLNVGGRYSHERQTELASQRNITGAFVLVPSSVEGTFKKFTPSASIRYEIAPRTNVYASYSQGFRSGVFPGSPPSNTDLSTWKPAKQEVVDAFEVGFKTAGRRYRFELAGFYYDYKDLQLSATIQNPDCLGVPTCLRVLTLPQNVPHAKIKGIEGSFEVEPIDNLTVRGSATWLHARYGSGSLFSGVGVNPALGSINTNSNPLRTYRNVSQVGLNAQDISGLQMSRAPNFSANFGTDYFIPNGEGGVRFSANVKYTDSYVVTNPSVWGPLVAPQFQRQQRFREGKYALVNASVTWTDPNDHFYVRAWGNNLTNHKYRLHYAGTASGTYSPMAEPLTYGGTVGYKF